jgi:hypothetical protein
VEEEAPREPGVPIWWKPGKFNGVLPKKELDMMANADCRFIDPVTGCLEDS